MASTTIRMSATADTAGRLTATNPAPPATALAPCAVRAGDTADCLPPGTRLRDFVIDRVLGEGGFGVVYSAYDLALGRRVAIKEYMPAALARRTSDYGVQVRSSAQQQMAFAVGLKSFVKEARLLARFDHPALIKVHQFWEENGTAYFVMPYYTAPTLKQWLANLAAHGTAPDDAWIRGFFRQALDALAFLHRNECLHRDVSPENILVLDDRSPLLLDFGAARRVVGDFTQALTVILKPGYAPLEQYTGSTTSASVRQGPWTDLYALCAVMYFVISGRPPFAAVDRVVNDRLLPAADVARGRYSESLLAAIDAGLQLHPGRRPQSAEALAEMLGAAPSAPRMIPAVADPDRTVLQIDAARSTAPLTAVVRALDIGTTRSTRPLMEDPTVPAWQAPAQDTRLTAALAAGRNARSEPAAEPAESLVDRVARYLESDGARVRLAAICGVALAVAAAVAGVAAFVSGSNAPTATIVTRSSMAARTGSAGDIVVAPLPITVAPRADRAAVAAASGVGPSATAASATAPSAMVPPSAVAPPAINGSAVPARPAATAERAARSPASSRRPLSATRSDSAPQTKPAAGTVRPGEWVATPVPSPAMIPPVTAAATLQAKTRALPAAPAVTASQPIGETAAPAPIATAAESTAIASSPAAIAAAERPRAVERPHAAEVRAISKPQPQFPVEALRDGVSRGRVTVEYTVETDGSIAQARVVSAEPQSVFNRAARSAVLRWRFEPVAQATQGVVEFVFDATK